jgi:hypothetical protein
MRKIKLFVNILQNFIFLFLDHDGRKQGSSGQQRQKTGGKWSNLNLGDQIGRYI